MYNIDLDLDPHSLVGLPLTEAIKTAKRFLYKVMAYPANTIKISIPIDNTILLYYNSNTEKQEICEAYFLEGATEGRSGG